MKVDLHCHSSVSDGMLSPAEVVRRAARNGVDVLALTDHDDVSGLPEAREAAREHGVRLVDGVEISVSWEETTVHIVGLGVRADAPALEAGLAAVRSGRNVRAEQMANALEAIGIQGALEGAGRHARNSRIIGRTHFARYLVEIGLVADVKAAFERYLVRGRPGFVTHLWVELEQAVDWITAAGGTAVIAHPGRYRISTKDRLRLLEAFKSYGGRAIEVVSGAHGPDLQREFARLARRFGFAASCASDFHAPGESPLDLGGTQPLPEDLQPVWKALV